MSRSYKKTPYAGDTRGKRNKRFANHKVRQWLRMHPEESVQHSGFRKVYESYDICDYGWTLSWHEFWRNEVNSWKHWGYKYRDFPSKSHSREQYMRWYVRK